MTEEVDVIAGLSWLLEQHRWLIVDQHDRVLTSFQLRSSARRWLRGIKESNRPVTDGWEIVRRDDFDERPNAR